MAAESGRPYCRWSILTLPGLPPCHRSGQRAFNPSALPRPWQLRAGLPPPGRPIRGKLAHRMHPGARTVHGSQPHRRPGPQRPLRLPRTRALGVPTVGRTRAENIPAIGTCPIRPTRFRGGSSRSTSAGADRPRVRYRSRHGQHRRADDSGTARRSCSGTCAAALACGPHPRTDCGGANTRIISSRRRRSIEAAFTERLHCGSHSQPVSSLPSGLSRAEVAPVTMSPALARPVPQRQVCVIEGAEAAIGLRTRVCFAWMTA